MGQIRMDTTVCVFFFGLVMGQIRMDMTWVSGLVIRGQIWIDTTGVSGLVIGQIRVDRTGGYGLVVRGPIRMDTTWISGLFFRGRINYGHNRGYLPGYESH